ncbi:UbiA family prenyltransferase [Parafilimonas sp.]|uniref:UbiA family prenyltransferase n=1 Tax=Parafilimonas sp. TaxID=1969739 RepID=UPI0039E57EE0
MIQKSTIQLLRIPFSFFLMPVFWFALSFVESIHVTHAVLLFLIIHVLVYPASNGYNSYMDRDSTSIGGIKNPLQPTSQLFVFTAIMDVAAVLLSLLISPLTATCIFIYIMFSRLYSYRPIRLKKYALISYIVVIFNQGSLIFFTVFNAVNNDAADVVPWAGCICATLLIGGFYPITQIYQYKEDEKDHVETISMLLGETGTFIFCGIIYTLAFFILFVYFLSIHKLLLFFILFIFFIPVAIYFTVWFLQVNKNAGYADFKHTMRMNKIASACTNAAFITILILNQL